jgi:hypothetical protein
MSWRLNIPYHSLEEPLYEIGLSAQHLEGEDGAVTRQFALDMMLHSDARTVADVVQLVEQAEPAQRREMLNRARTGAGLETVEDVEGRERFEAANQALLNRPPRPVPSCAVCGANPTTSGGMPDLNVPVVRRWHCGAHSQRRPQRAPSRDKSPQAGPCRIQAAKPLVPARE